MLGQILEAFGERVDLQRQREWDADQADHRNEFEILKLMAERGSPEIQGIAGAALLELASGSAGRRVRKGGLRGFLGETQKSPYLDQVKQAIEQAQITAPPAPRASLPAGSPVEPGKPGIQAPPPPPMSPDPYVTSRPEITQQVDGMRTLTPPEDNLAMIQQASPVLSGQAQPAMAPPPPPKPAYTRLFPTAAEIAQQQAEGALQGRINAMTGALQQAGAGQDLQQQALLGLAGAPQRRPLAVQAMIFTLKDGSEVVGVFDPNTQTYEVDGQPIDPQLVVNARKPSSTAPRPPSTQFITGPDGTVREFEKGGGGEIANYGKVGKPQAPPPAMSGTVVLGPDAPEGEGVYERPRSGGVGARLGDRPPQAGVKTQEQKQYEVWLGQVNEEIKARGKNQLTGRTTLLTPQQKDEIAQRVTGQRGMTYNDLSLGAKGGQVTQRGARSGKSREDIDRLIQTIQQGYGRSGVVPGSATPMTAPPAPPRP